MTEQANRIDWLERQLAQVRHFIARDKEKAAKDPVRPSVRMALDSWLTHEEELQQELRQAKSALQREVVEFRLMGMRMDGSIPLKLLAILSDKFNAALSQAAYHLRHGKSPSNGVPGEMVQALDLRLSALGFGSTRLLFAGNITPDTTGDSPMEGALEQIFDVLQAPSQDKLRDLVSVIGLPATKALGEMLKTLDKQGIGAEITWPAPNSKVYRWGGSLEEVRSAHKRLSSFEVIPPVPQVLTGRIIELKETGAFYIRGAGQKYKITYNKQQYGHIQQLSLGMEIAVETMRYRLIDPLSGREIDSFKLVTGDSPLALFGSSHAGLLAKPLSFEKPPRRLMLRKEPGNDKKDD